MHHVRVVGCGSRWWSSCGGRASSSRAPSSAGSTPPRSSPSPSPSDRPSTRTHAWRRRSQDDEEEGGGGAAQGRAARGREHTAARTLWGAGSRLWQRTLSRRGSRSAQGGPWAERESANWSKGVLAALSAPPSPPSLTSLPQLAPSAGSLTVRPPAAAAAAAAAGHRQWLRWQAALRRKSHGKRRDGEGGACLRREAGSE